MGFFLQNHQKTNYSDTPVATESSHANFPPLQTSNIEDLIPDIQSTLLMWVSYASGPSLPNVHLDFHKVAPVCNPYFQIAVCGYSKHLIVHTVLVHTNAYAILVHE